MKIKKSKEDKIFDIFLYGIAIIILIIVLYPMYFIIIASFSNPAEVAAGNITFFPKGITLKATASWLNTHSCGSVTRIPFSIR